MQQPGGVVENNFVVSGNTITAANFSISGLVLNFCLNDQVGVGCGTNHSELFSPGNGLRAGNVQGFAGITFNFVDPNVPIGVSEPAGLLSLLPGFFAMVLMRHRRSLQRESGWWLRQSDLQPE